MKDIGSALNKIMQDKQCSPVYAFFLLSEKRVGDNNGLCKLQSESKKKTCGRLCDKSNF